MRSFIYAFVLLFATAAMLPSMAARADAIRRGARVGPQVTPTYEVLYTFEAGTKPFIGGPDGSTPNGDLSFVNGLFYGTTNSGGLVGTHYGNGVVFSLSPSGVETVLHRFTGGTDGFEPISGLTYVNGTFYGTTPVGGLKNGTGGNGTVFAMSPSGLESVIPLTPENGDFAEGKLTAYNGALFGTAAQGGLDGNNGTFFRVSPDGTLRVVHRFKGPPSDGSNPNGGAVEVGGIFYGLTSLGGAYNDGAVYAITPLGAEKLIHSFGGPRDGKYPVDRLILVNGLLYGATALGGAKNCGVVFAIDPLGEESVLHSFAGPPEGGCDPQTRLTAFNGAFYGATAFGGATNEGTIYKVSLSGTERMLYSFTCTKTGDCPSGAAPSGGLTAVGNSLYGTIPGNGLDQGGVFFKFTP